MPKMFLTTSICNNNPPGTCLIDGGLKLCTCWERPMLLLLLLKKKYTIPIPQRVAPLSFCTKKKQKPKRCLSRFKKHMYR